MLPDNFFYFLSLFFIATSLGSYLLSSYKRNLLIILNACACYLIAIRAVTEFYLPQIESFYWASWVTTFHSLLATLAWAFLYYVIWFYIQPFRGKAHQKWGNRLFKYLVLFIPNLIISFTLFYRKIYFLLPEKIEGYWQFSIHQDFYLTNSYFFYIQSMPIIVVFIFIWSIVRDKTHRWQKAILTLSFIFLPYLYFNHFLISGANNIPNSAGPLTVHLIIISWFVSDYRLFQNAFSGTLKDFINSISDLAVFTNLNKEVLYTNQRASQQFFAEQGSKKSIVEVLTNFSRLTFQEINILFQNLLQNKTNEEELQLIVKQELRIYRLKVADFHQGNRHVGYTFLLTDLTDIRKKEEELEQTNVIKDQLFMILGHDLRKPAMAFRGITQKLNYLIDKQDFLRIQQFGGHLNQAAVHLNNLLDNILTWALSQKKSMNLKRIPVEVASVLEELLPLFQERIKEKQINFTYNAPSELYVFGDEPALATIFRNLVDNAIKFTPKQGTITVEVSKSNQQILFQIKDSGIGMQEEQIEQLFQMSVDKSKKGTEGEDGIGIGLVLVKNLIDQQGGTIKIESEWQQGTAIKIWLPTSEI